MTLRRKLLFVVVAAWIVVLHIDLALEKLKRERRGRR